MRKYLLGAVFLTLVATACNKDKDFTRAIILDTGDITVDGCGYLLRLEDGREENRRICPLHFSIMVWKF